MEVSPVAFRSAALAVLVGAAHAVSPLEPQQHPSGSTLVERAAPAQRLALLVGIDSYAPNATRGSVPPLAGAARDVRAASSLLQSRFGFAAADVLTLVNEQATHEAIVRSFASHLLGRAREGTEVIVWFSGHGSRVPDTSGVPGAEEGGFDTSFLAYDSRADERNGEYDLVDDELRSLLVAASALGAHITVVLDTCHAAGGDRGSDEARVRSATAGARPLARGMLASFWPESVEFTDDDANDIQRAPWATIAACATDQRAHEMLVPALDGSRAFHGVLSYVLLDVLEQARPGITLTEIAQQARARVTRIRPDQNVSAYGPMNTLLFSAAFGMPSPGFPARATTLSELLVDAGSLHLLREGSVVEVRDERGAPLGEATIVSTCATQSRGRWNASPPPAVAERTLRAVERSRPALAEPLPISTSVDLIADLVRESTLGKLSANSDAYSLAMSADQESAVLHDSTGVFVANVALATAPIEASAAARQNGALERVLRKELVWRELNALAAQPSEFAVKIDVRLPTPEDLKQHRSKCDASEHSALQLLSTVDSPTSCGSLELQAVRGGTHVAYIHVGNASNVPLYVYVVDVSEDRTVAQAWPAKGQHKRLAAGDSAGGDFHLFLPDSWTVERAMRDRFIAFASPIELPVSIEDAYESRSDRSSVLMPTALQAALSAGANRLGGFESPERGLGLAFVDVFLHPRL